MINIKKYLNLEGFIIAANHISIILIVCTQKFSKFDISIFNLALCIMYIMHSYKYLKKGVFINTIILLTFSIIISSHSLNNHLYNTSYIGLFSYSLIGVTTYLINYLYLTKNKDNIGIIKLYSYLSMIAGSVTAFYFYNYTMKSLGLVADEKEAQNFFYYFLVPMPLLFCFLERKIRVLIYLIILVGVFFSFKRSGLIIMLASGFFIFRDILITSSKKEKNRFLFIVFLIIGLYAIIHIVGYENISSMQERMNNLSEDKGSGRINIINIFLEYLKSYRFDEYILGHGYGSFYDYFTNYRHSYNSAHNDYIEVFFSYGIIGLIAIIIMTYKVIKNTIKLRKTVFFIPMVSFCSMYLVFNISSSVYHYYNFSLPMFVFIAYIDFVVTNKKIIYEITLG